jgi:integrase
VFANRYGKYSQPGNTLIKFRKLLDQAGLPRIRIHDLRHSAASLLILVLKMPPKLVQELLGHSTLDMTMNFYTHADESQQRAMMDAFDRFLEGD